MNKRAWKKWRAAENWRNTKTLSDDALLALSESLSESIGDDEGLRKARGAQQQIVSKVLDARGLI